MKRIIERVFPKREQQRPEHPPPSAVSSELTSSDVESYYLRIIVDVLKRMLVPVDSVEVGVKRSAAAGAGGNAYAGYVRILRWEPIMPVLLQNLPVIDARIRKVVAASVILENTQFTGLWFQATSAAEGVPSELAGTPAELVRQPLP